MFSNKRFIYCKVFCQIHNLFLTQSTPSPFHPFVPSYFRTIVSSFPASLRPQREEYTPHPFSQSLPHSLVPLSPRIFVLPSYPRPFVLTASQRPQREECTPHPFSQSHPHPFVPSYFRTIVSSFSASQRPQREVSPLHPLSP